MKPLKIISSFDCLREWPASQKLNAGKNEK